MVSTNDAHNRATPATTFGARLRRLRLVKGVSQEKLAKTLGVGQSTVSLMERFGTPETAASYIPRLARALGVSQPALRRGARR